MLLYIDKCASGVQTPHFLKIFLHIFFRRTKQTFMVELLQIKKFQKHVEFFAIQCKISSLELKKSLIYWNLKTNLKKILQTFFSSKCIIFFLLENGGFIAVGRKRTNVWVYPFGCD